MQKDEEVGKVAQATPIVICVFISTIFPSPFGLMQDDSSKSTGTVLRFNY